MTTVTTWCTVMTSPPIDRIIAVRTIPKLRLYITCTVSVVIESPIVEEQRKTGMNSRSTVDASMTVVRRDNHWKHLSEMPTFRPDSITEENRCNDDTIQIGCVTRCIVEPQCIRSFVKVYANYGVRGLVECASVQIELGRGAIIDAQEE